jgi:hypothetical protein
MKNSSPTTPYPNLLFIPTWHPSASTAEKYARGWSFVSRILSLADRRPARSRLFSRARNPEKSRAQTGLYFFPPGPEWCSAPKQSRAQADHRRRRCREYLLALEEERRKIQVFQRELPVSIRAAVFCSFRAVSAPFVRRRFLEEERRKIQVIRVRCRLLSCAREDRSAVFCSLQDAEQGRAGFAQFGNQVLPATFFSPHAFLSTSLSRLGFLLKSTGVVMLI